MMFCISESDSTITELSYYTGKNAIFTQKSEASSSCQWHVNEDLENK